jgi:aspartate kinase
MPLIVQKFGGTSVADSQKILAAARKAVRAQQEGNQVVMVVSAMGKNTDALIQLAGELNEDPPAREMDMLLSTGEQVSVALMAMAIHSLGHRAVSLTGGQIGIRTDSSHTKARIRSISTDRMKKLLDEGNIVIAAGFQGIDEDFNITTLGRGGSDTTAVALAAVLEADSCEIYTDVDGVYTTDPRLLPEARKVARVSYEEMLELASLGAGVMHSRSIEFGKKFSVPIHVRSSFSDVPGSIIGVHSESTVRSVCGAALTKNEAQVTIEGVPDRPGSSLEIFAKIAARNIPVDMIVQNVGTSGRTDISFTVMENDLNATLKALHAAAQELGAERVTHDAEMAKVSVVGLGMAQQTGVAEKMFRSLSDAGINIEAITTSEIKISALVSRTQAREALRVLHQAFELDQAPLDAYSELSSKPAEQAAVDAVTIVDHLRHMEELTIESITMDDTQARLTIAAVPDKPGIAAQVFEQISASGVFVDMIVQSTGQDGRANLSFTVPQRDLATGLEAAKKLSAALGGARVDHSPLVAKLSVAGIGMRSHTEVGLRMFQALANEEINVEMINTSEVQVNVVVAGTAGQRGLALLKETFADTMR